MTEYAMGIDLGTSNSCVAVGRDGQVEVVPNELGELIHASVVSFLGQDQVIVGNDAKKNIVTKPKQTVWSSKRLMGRHAFSEATRKARERMPYDIVDGPDNSVRIAVEGKEYSPPEIGAIILREMKRITERYLGEPVNKAVITVPAYFNDNQRNATKDAGAIAGLDVLRIINEPTAAALAYGLGEGRNERVAIYDLGGGTFDISILDIQGDLFEVLATSGDTYLGGDDFDARIVDWLAETFMQKEKVDLREEMYSMQKLREAAEKAKIGLSQFEAVQIDIPLIHTDASGYSIDFSIQLARPDFNKMVADLIQRTFVVCDEALSAAGIHASEIDQVILVGGSTRSQVVRYAVKHYFGREPHGAINPDQVVAVGAAIQGHALVSNEVTSTLLDVTPLSLQIGTVGGYCDRIIDKNTPVPIERARLFTNAADFQEAVRIQVFQGESNRAEENTLLGEFEFTGIPQKRRGEVEIEVTFDINSDGILDVGAREVETGQRTGCRINLSAGLSHEEVLTAATRNQELELMAK